jgi:hypothetical protein
MNKFQSFLLVGLICSAVSCVIAKTYTVEEKKMRIEGDRVLVIKTNGDTVFGRKLSVPSIWNLNGHWVELDGKKYQFEGLTGYQDKKYFYGKFGTVWARQLKRGRMNLYEYEVVTYNSVGSGKNEYDTHFVFQKGNGKLLELSGVAISEWLADNRRAYDMFNSQFKRGRVVFPKQLQHHPKVLFDVVDVYNGDK